MIFTFIRILFLLVRLLATSQGTSLVGSRPNDHSSPQEHLNALSHGRVSATPGETAAHNVASSWCSAYRSSDTERLAALETQEMEIVDRFGDWHHLIGLKAREQFWKDGFDMTSRKDFFPECSVQHVRLIGLNAAIAQVTVSYDEGIALKGGDRVPPFSEIHTLVLVKVEGRWLISAQTMVQQISLSESQERTPFAPNISLRRSRHKARESILSFPLQHESAPAQDEDRSMLGYVGWSSALCECNLALQRQ